jgi:N5-(cytidine 5'-diphosphoramidyl)-L-glutamine hydrolase
MKIALSTRVTEATGYVEPRDSISHDWLKRLGEWGMVPFPVPNLLNDTASYIAAIAPDLLVLTGGDDLGATPDRDRAETELFDIALGRGLPVLGVCRGLQFINQRFGGSTVEIAGHVAVSHKVGFSPCWQPQYGNEDIVNSYHNLAIAPDGLGAALEVTATDSDGLIEAARHSELPVAGIMWHPERAAAPVGDRALFEFLIGQGVG